MAKKKFEHPVTTIENVSLEAFEAAVYGRDYEYASQQLVPSLRKLRAGAEFIGYPVNNPELKKVLYTRFCSAVIALLADPNFMLSEDGLSYIAAEHSIMDMLFRASHYGTSDHLLPQMTSDPSETDQKKIKFRDPQSLLKFMLTYSLRSGFNLNFEETFKKAPDVTFPTYLGMMSHLLTINKTAQERREKLNGLHAIFEDVDLNDAVLPVLSDTYMYTSYCLNDDKHDFKGLVHRLMARKMLSSGLTLPVLGERQIKQRPTMLICVEWFTSLHAMYRCWAPAIRQLRKRFRLVGIGQAAAIDEIAVKEFDEWITVPQDNIVLEQIAEQVKSVEPDIIYYPSVGMALWWVAMASLRLAPIQVMTLGHPATTNSPEMDYAIVEENSCNPHDFSEKLLEVPIGTFKFAMRPDATFPPEQTMEDEPEVVRIAIPAMLCKLNAEFMEACKRIQDGAKTPVQFHFFINMIGTTLFQTAAEIREWLPNALIYERMQYNDYIRYMQNCHVHFSTFPFGGTNSNIDSFKLGLPILTMDGNQPHSRFDALMLRRINLPEWLITHSIDDYVETGIRLIDSHAERNGLRDYLLHQADIDGAFFGEPEAQYKDNFLKAMVKIYEQHETLTEKVIKL